MKLRDYIISCKRTSRGVLTHKERLTNFALGLAGEAAEVNELINYQHTNSLEESPIFGKDTLCKEIGDVFWYTAMLLHELRGNEDFSVNYEGLISYGRGEILFVGYTDYYSPQTKSINIGLVANRISTMAGNIADKIKKYVFHEHEIDEVWIISRLGDIYWLCEFLLRCFSLTVSETMDRNVAKLKERYPDGFSPEMSMKKLDENPNGTLEMDSSNRLILY